MKKVLLMLTVSVLLTGCSMRDKRPTFSLKGVWVMTQVTVPEGYTYQYPADEGTWMRLYEGDSMMYECKLTQTEQALVVRPESKCGVTLIDKGNDEHLYLEEEDPRPLIVVNDSTITIQRMGRVYTWQRAEDIEREWGTEIHAIVERDLVNGATSDDMHNYVLSAKEREQANIIHKLIYIFSWYAFTIRILIHSYLSGIHASLNSYLISFNQTFDNIFKFRVTLRFTTYDLVITK